MRILGSGTRDDGHPSSRVDDVEVAILDGHARRPGEAGHGMCRRHLLRGEEIRIKLRNSRAALRDRARGK
jgi:hypothetical protein